MIYFVKIVPLVLTSLHHAKWEFFGRCLHSRILFNEVLKGIKNRATLLRQYYFTLSGASDEC